MQGVGGSNAEPDPMSQTSSTNTATTTNASSTSGSTNTTTGSSTTGTVEPLPCQAGMCPDDGDVCNGIELCDPDTNLCMQAGVPECDDGIACNGVETCDAERGCVSGEPVVCDAPGAYCDENTGECACAPPFLGPDCTVKTALFAYFGRVRGLAEQGRVLWVTTTNGLWVLDFAQTPGDPGDDSWLRFDALSGDTGTGSIEIDAEGNKWLAGDDRPLARLDDGGTALDQSDDRWYFYAASPNFSPRALGIDDSGKVWTGRLGETLTFWDANTPDDRADDEWRPASDFDSARTVEDIDSILSEPEGAVWLGSSERGLFAYDEARGQVLDFSGIPLLGVHHMAWEDGSLWLSGRSEMDTEPTQLATAKVPRNLSRLSPNDWFFHPAPHAVDTFDVDSERVWAAAPTSGLSCLDVADETWASWSFEASVQSILTRSSSDLWFGADSVFYLDHGGSCTPDPGRIQELVFEQNLRSPARDAAIEGDGIWLATDRGVDYVHTKGTPFDPLDDQWVHFDTSDTTGLEDLQGVVVGPDGIKYFWGDTWVFALDDGGSAFDKGDDQWVGYDTGQPLWVSGVVDADGVLMVVSRAFGRASTTPEVVVFDPAGTPTDPSDDELTTISSGLPGAGRSMATDSAGEIWLGTEANDNAGNLFHWNRGGTPTDGEDDIWTPVRAEDARVWKLVRDPTGGVWCTVGGFDGDVFHFFDNGTPTDVSDDYWQIYPELGSAMEIAPSGDGWFRMPGGAGILDVGGTPRDPSDDVSRVLLSPEALRFSSDLWTNGTIDDQGRFWVVDENVQVFELVE